MGGQLAGTPGAVVPARAANRARLEAMSSPTRQQSVRGSAPAIAAAALADAVLILVFAAIGRDAHQRADVIIGVFLTAWPFLAGAALAWLAARAWRRPLSLPTGVAVWLGAVAGGMVLRAVTGQTVVLASSLWRSSAWGCSWWATVHSWRSCAGYGSPDAAQGTRRRQASPVRPCNRLARPQRFAGAPLRPTDPEGLNQ